jgi:ABC-type amino acid transport substrate-binding protein
MIKLFVVFLTTQCFLFSAYANDLNIVMKEKKLRVAVDTTYPPMEFEESNGEVAGLDIDLARAIGKILKVRVEFIVMPWDGILAGLQSNRYDIIMSSMNITPERTQQVSFVPYLMMGQIFVVKTSTAPVKNEHDLKGRVVAVQADTTSFNALENFKKAGVAMKEIKAFKGATETFSALKSNQADTIITDEAVGYYYAGLDPKTFSISGVAIAPEPIGIAVKKMDVLLLRSLENAVKMMKASGEYATIYKKWLKVAPKI